jgi:hypothetical protein
VRQEEREDEGKRNKYSFPHSGSNQNSDRMNRPSTLNSTGIEFQFGWDMHRGVGSKIVSAKIIPPEFREPGSPCTSGCPLPKFLGASVPICTNIAWKLNWRNTYQHKAVKVSVRKTLLNHTSVLVLKSGCLSGKIHRAAHW